MLSLAHIALLSGSELYAVARACGQAPVTWLLGGRVICTG
jgi:hypothetical protein